VNDALQSVRPADYHDRATTVFHLRVLQQRSFCDLTLVPRGDSGRQDL